MVMKILEHLHVPVSGRRVARASIPWTSMVTCIYEHGNVTTAGCPGASPCINGAMIAN
eukprot:CAMPEP_0178750992 /NCGR_PEP_ID=MMETSP0744-20121128/10295_1 /TAXON_ID=913974 /ORGANISM="Nitzschia punctata, Strain CCMP561" /LENGTH=57 /DNA_ID=CAMNT_0020404621 /DNA_START=115 /DNA_END=288 /DNA_ORIENTATION=-